MAKYINKYSTTYIKKKLNNEATKEIKKKEIPNELNNEHIQQTRNNERTKYIAKERMTSREK